MSSSSINDVEFLIKTGEEGILTLDGNWMERIIWFLRDARFELEDEGAGISLWMKQLSGLGRYRSGDVVFIAGNEVEGELFTEGCTVFSQYDSVVQTPFTVWSENFTTASTLSRGK